MELPLGFRFHLSPQESLFYLKTKVCGNPLPCDYEGLIPERNPYDAKQLAELFLTAESGRELFFFAKLRRKGYVGPKVNGKGSWRCDSRKEIGCEHGPLTGEVRNLRYWEVGSKNHNRYSMTEYALSDDEDMDMLVPYDELKEWVLCCLTMKKRCKNGKKAEKPADP